MSKVLVLIQLLLLECIASWLPLLATFEPPLYVSSEAFYNQSITSVQSMGFQITGVLPATYGNFQASLRVQDPTVSFTFKYALDKLESPHLLRSWLEGQINYYTYDSNNSTLTGIGACNLVMQTAVSRPWMQLWISLGVDQVLAWSDYHDRSLYGIFPHLRIALTQVFPKRLVCSVFVGSNTLTQYTCNFTFLGGVFVAYRLLDSWYLQARSVVRTSDLLSESCVVSMAQVTLALVWFDSSREDAFLYRMEALQ